MPCSDEGGCGGYRGKPPAAKPSAAAAIMARDKLGDKFSDTVKEIIFKVAVS